MQGSPDHPKAPLGNNYRPPQPLLHRPIRTNIDFKTAKTKAACPTMYREVYYKGIYTSYTIILFYYIIVLESGNKLSFNNKFVSLLLISTMQK